MCSCGETGLHVVAKRQSNDGFTVELWSDGMLTAAYGTRFPKCGPARNAWSERADRTVGESLIGEVCLYDMAEIRRAYPVLRKEARRPYLGLPAMPTDANRRWSPPQVRSLMTLALAVA